MGTKLKTLSTAVLAIVLTYADANRLKKDAENILKETRDDVVDALRKNGNAIDVQHADGMVSTVKVTSQDRPKGVSALEAAKVEGIGESTIRKLSSIDPGKAKAALQSGLITQAQYNSLVEFTTSSMVLVQTKKPKN